MFNKFNEEAWIQKDVFEFMIKEANSKLPLETGGRIYGYHEPVINVKEIVGPGPKADHQPKGFMLDSEYHKTEIDRIFDTTDFLYMGDWHTHPGGPGMLSHIDMESAEMYFQEIVPQQKYQISLILNGFRDNWTPNVWIFDGTHYQPKTISIYTKEEGRVQTFKSSTLLTGYAINNKTS